MFEHSVKVPRHFKVAANIFKKVSTEGGSVKTLLYDEKLRHFKTNVLYALVTETIKHAADIEKLFEHCNIFKTESRLDPWLAKVLTTELLFGKKTLPGKSKPEQTILSYKEQFEKYVSDHQDDLKNEVTPRPRYVRVNTNLFTTSDAIRAFQDEGFRFIRCTSGTYEDYLEQIQKLNEDDFTQDYHVKTIFVFAPGTKWHDHELYLENKIILQDKATAMAVHLLAAPSGSVALDMCAAPGMKTTQLAAYMRNEGKIYAVERNEKRYETLCDFVKKTGCKCVQTFHKDALEIKRGDFEDVEYILLDPSCSGSGMDFCVHSYIEASRLAKLTSLQEKFLKHAMNAFPKAKRIVYSTCSLFPEENERVITNVVKTSRAKWRVQDVKELLNGQWKNFGSAMYGSMGTRCMYSKPESDFTTGFFLAVLDRDEKDLAKSLKQKVSGENNEMECESVDGLNQDVSNEVDNLESGSKKNKKKDKNRVEDTEGLKDETENPNEHVVEKVPNKKKKKRHIDTENEVAIEEDQAQNDIEPIKKKKKKQKSIEHIENPNDEALEEICEDFKVKSKKKRKHKEIVDNVTDELLELHVTKKKKKDVYKDVSDNIDPNDSRLEKKKKKKKKHKEQEV